MRIVKTLFKTEIDLKPGELREFMASSPVFMLEGLGAWLKREFKLDLFGFNKAIQGEQNGKK